MLADRIPGEPAVQLLGDTAQQQCASGAIRDVSVTDWPFPSADAFEEISRMAFGVIQMDLVRAEGFTHQIGRIRDQGVSIHREPSVGTDEARATFTTDGFVRVRFA